MSDNKRVMTDSESVKVMSAVAALLAVVGSAEFSTEEKESDRKAINGDAETLGTDDLIDVLERSANALKVKRDEADRAILVAFKSQTDAACHTARLAAIEAYREFHGMSPAAKKLYKIEPPTSTSVPLTDVIPFAPEGMTPDDVVKLAHRCGFKLTPGRKLASDRSLYVQIGADVVKAALATE